MKSFSHHKTLRYLGVASIGVHKHHQMDRSQVGKNAILNCISGELEAGVDQDSAEICLQR